MNLKPVCKIKHRNTDSMQVFSLGFQDWDVSYMATVFSEVRMCEHVGVHHTFP